MTKIKIISIPLSIKIWWLTKCVAHSMFRSVWFLLLSIWFLVRCKAASLLDWSVCPSNRPSVCGHITKFSSAAFAASYYRCAGFLSFLFLLFYCLHQWKFPTFSINIFCAIPVNNVRKTNTTYICFNQSEGRAGL